MTQAKSAVSKPCESLFPPPHTKAQSLLPILSAPQSHILRLCLWEDAPSCIALLRTERSANRNTWTPEHEKGEMKNEYLHSILLCKKRLFDKYYSHAKYIMKWCCNHVGCSGCFQIRWMFSNNMLLSLQHNMLLCAYKAYMLYFLLWAWPHTCTPCVGLILRPGTDNTVTTCPFKPCARGHLIASESVEEAITH